MKFTVKNKTVLILTCPIFIFLGIPLTAFGYVAGIVLIFSGITNLVLGLCIQADSGEKK